jgi:hypothetical protein
MSRLRSVNVGLPRDVTWNGKTVETALRPNVRISFGPIGENEGGLSCSATSC